MMTKANAPDSKLLLDLDEYWGSGFCEMPEASPSISYSRALRRWFENYPLPEYQGERLYPSRVKYHGVRSFLVPDYSYNFSFRENVFEEKLKQAGEKERKALRNLKDVYEQERAKCPMLKPPHTIGGNGYTHAIVNYDRVINEGLNSYTERIHLGLEKARPGKQEDFFIGLLDLMEGIQTWHSRIRQRVEQSAPAPSNKERLVEALNQVPFKPARNFYEALVCYNIVYYIDGCDNPGRMDQVLFPYFQNDTDTDRDKALTLIRRFSENVAANNGWSAALGGSNVDGTAAYNDLTGVVIESTRNLHRPSLELRVRQDMPDDLWSIAMETLATGCGQPAFYNEAGYLAALRSARLGIAEEDLVRWNGGGCTETMIHGCSNVGSLDAGINMLLILEETLNRELTRNDLTFDCLLAAYKRDVSSVVREVTDRLNVFYRARAENRPQIIRSLLMDDCIERGLDFNDGGARYNWSVINIAALTNVADSLEALRQLVFEKKEAEPAGLLHALENNFEGNESLRQKLLSFPKFGNDRESVDSLAAEIGEYVCRDLLSRECTRGGKFLPSHIMFETYAHAGFQVGATPDGRFAHAPVADSCGPMQGRDTKGPTAMLNSAARLPQNLVAGTPVLNVRFSKQIFAAKEGRRNVQILVEEYFRMGGLQVQISVLDHEELTDALEHPEDHENLIVRIGGFSTYFNRLSEELKHEVVKRTEYLA